MSFFAYYQHKIFLLFYRLTSKDFPVFQFPSLKCNALILNLLIQYENSMSNTDNHNFYKVGNHTIVISFKWVYFMYPWLSLSLLKIR